MRRDATVLSRRGSRTSSGSARRDRLADARRRRRRVGDGARTAWSCDADGACSPTPTGRPRWASRTRRRSGPSSGGARRAASTCASATATRSARISCSSPCRSRTGAQVIGALRVSAPLGRGRGERPLELARARADRRSRSSARASCSPGSSPARSRGRSSSSARAAGRLGRGDLDARVEPEGPREIDELGRSFNRMADELAANLAAQRDFVANASHQLRTPLTGIKLRLEAIRAEGGAAAEQAAKAEAELDRLSALVDDLLALARAAADQAPGESRRPRRGGAGGGRRWASRRRSAGHELVVAERRRRRGSGPRRRDVAHILDNLLENAIRYTPRGSRIEVAADATAVGRGSSSPTPGPGIPAEERARVFERFYRGSTGGPPAPAPGSASRSSPSSPSAGTAASSCSTAPERGSARAFPQRLPRLLTRALTVSEGSRCYRRDHEPSARPPPRPRSASHSRSASRSPCTPRLHVGGSLGGGARRGPGAGDDRQRRPRRRTTTTTAQATTADPEPTHDRRPPREVQGPDDELDPDCDPAGRRLRRRAPPARTRARASSGARLRLGRRLGGGRRRLERPRLGRRRLAGATPTKSLPRRWGVFTPPGGALFPAPPSLEEQFAHRAKEDPCPP